MKPTSPHLDLTGDRRAEELAASLAAVRDRITTACQAAGRQPDEVTLIAVTKTFPAQDVRRLAELGVTDFGENRDQEASLKASLVPGVRWHFVGRLQRNKARSVARYADVVHSVDRPELVDSLEAARAGSERPLDVLIQVDLDPRPDPRRGGVGLAEVAGLADRIVVADHLRLAGVMAVAPRGADPHAAFERLAAVSARLRVDHPAAAMVSAGMSGDLEAAIQHGATHARVGTALLGGRENLVR